MNPNVGHHEAHSSAMLYVRALYPWFAILALAFVNGAFRELVLVPRLRHPWALLISGILLSCCVLAIAYLTVARLRISNSGQLLAIGCTWLLLTLLFEFGFGHFFQGKSWNELRGAYQFENGNLWSLVLLVVLFGPLLAGRLRSAG
jgi:uncharacterized membrane protein YadS